MASGGTRVRPNSGGVFVTPFGSTSRLVACPVCGKQVHLLLATSHVESHFGAVDGEVTNEAGPGDQPSGAPCSAEEARTAAAEHTEGDASCGGACGGEEEEEDVGLENAEFGGALAPPPPAAPDGQAPSYVPGTDAVWAAFKLQARHRVAAPPKLRRARWRQSLRLKHSPLPRR